jgi:hypothetical protein
MTVPEIEPPARPALGVADARAVPQRDGNIAGLA